MLKRVFFCTFLVFILGVYEYVQIIRYLYEDLTAHIVINLLVPVLVIIIYIYILFKRNFNGGTFALGNFLSFIPILTISNLVAVIISVVLYYICNVNPSVSSYYLLMTIFEASIFFTMYFLFYKKEFNKQFNEFFKQFYKYISYVIVFFIVAFLLNDLLTIISTLIPATADEAANQLEIQNTLSLNSNKLIFILVLVVIGPIIEEFIYRYLLIEHVIIRGFKLNLMTYEQTIKCKDKRLVLKNNLLIIAIAIFAGLLFASAHAIAASSLINYIRDLFLYGGFAIGISLAYLYTRNVFVTISIHMLNNLMSVILILYSIRNGLL